MPDPLLDAFRHNAWANRQLIEFCRGLSRAQLSTKAVGAFGTATSRRIDHPPTA